MAKDNMRQAEKDIDKSRYTKKDQDKLRSKKDMD